MSNLSNKDMKRSAKELSEYVFDKYDEMPTWYLKMYFKAMMKCIYKGNLEKHVRKGVIIGTGHLLSSLDEDALVRASIIKIKFDNGIAGAVLSTRLGSNKVKDLCNKMKLKYAA